MEQTGYDASAAGDPAVVRKTMLDGLRRPGLEVHPFPTAGDPVSMSSFDLILHDIEPGPEYADLLDLLRDAAAPRVSDRRRESN